VKRRGRIQVEILEGVEVKDARNNGHDILSEGLVEWEGLEASYGVGGINKLETGDLDAWVVVGNCGSTSKQCSSKQDEEKPRMKERREKHGGK